MICPNKLRRGPANPAFGTNVSLPNAMQSKNFCYIVFVIDAYRSIKLIIPGGCPAFALAGLVRVSVLFRRLVLQDDNLAP